MSNSVLDWDGAVPLPLPMTTYSLNEKMFPKYPGRQNWSLNETQDELFRTELLRIEQNRSSSDQFSILHQESKRHLFLDDLHYIHNWTPEAINDHLLLFPDLVKEALNRSPVRLARAAVEWNSFANQFYTMRGRPVPDWPMYVQIQEDFGIYGKTRLHRLGRLLKRRLQERLSPVLERACLQYPQWKWVAQKHCYLTAALSEQYRLPSGKYSC
jgi:hypothetical protein